MAKSSNAITTAPAAMITNRLCRICSLARCFVLVGVSAVLNAVISPGGVKSRTGGFSGMLTAT